jgi:hypothetical protein
MADGTIVGPKEELQRVVELIMSEGPALGLHLNLGKTEVWSPLPHADYSGFPPALGVALVRPDGAHDGLALLGAAVGSADAVFALLQPKLQKLEETIAHIEDIPSRQCQFRLLQACALYPKVNYLLRTVSPLQVPLYMEQVDASYRAAILNLAGNDALDEHDFLAFSLPRALGGAACTAPGMLGDAPYFAARFQTRFLRAQIQRREVSTLTASFPAWLQSFNEAHPHIPSPVLMDDLYVSHPQEVLTQAVHHHQLTSVLQNPVVPACVKNLFAARKVPGAGAWLFVAPDVEARTMLTDREFLLALRFWLGKPIYQFNEDIQTRCPRCNFGVLDIYGRHAVACPGIMGASMRHNVVRNAMFSVAQKLNMRPELERALAVGDQRRRPGDVTLYNCHWKPDCLPVAIDVVGVNAFADSHRLPFLSHAELQSAEQAKFRSYAVLLQQHRLHFLPFAFTSLGGFGELAMKMITFLGKAWSTSRDVPVGVGIAYVQSILAVAIQRAQVSSWTDRGYVLDNILG